MTATPTPVLDPHVQAWLNRISEIAPSRGDEADPARERASAREISDLLFTEFGAPASADAQRSTHYIHTGQGDLRIDEYRPVGSGTEVLPAYLLLHGGSFRLGEVDELINVSFCSQRAALSGYAVYSLAYRLAPEHPFPAALDDAGHALHWLHERSKQLGIDPERIIVGGVSAGGNLSAALCLASRESGPAIRGQLLEVPLMDTRDNGKWLDEYAPVNGFSTLKAARGAYSNASQASSPLISPMLGDLSGLPPTHVMTAEFDPCRSSGEEYVRRLRAAGNSVTATRHLGHLHGTQGLTRRWRGARLWHSEVVSVLQDFAR